MLINRDEFNNQKVYEIFQAAYIECEMDEDGDVMARIDGVRIRAIAPKDRPFFIVSAMFAAKEGTTRLQLLELSNRFNDGMVMVRASVPATEKPVIYFDHFTMTEGGISGEEVVRVAQRFTKIIRDGLRVESCDTEDVIK